VFAVAVRPNQSAAFHAHLPESRLFVSNPGKHRTGEQGSEISLDHATVRQCEAYAAVVQRLRFPDANQSHASSSVQRGDGFQRRSTASPLPIRSQLLAMKRCPFEHQRHGSPREAATEDKERFDSGRIESTPTLLLSTLRPPRAPHPEPHRRTTGRTLERRDRALSNSIPLDQLL